MKQNKKSKKTVGGGKATWLRAHPFKSIALTLALGALLFGIIPYAVYRHEMNLQAGNMASTTPIRDLLLQAVDTKADAPVDPKTGDVYFPELRVYLPNDTSKTGPLQLTYSYFPKDVASEHTELSISSRPVFQQTSSKLYQAQDLESMFKDVPKLQACSRGIRLLYDDLGSKSDGFTLKQHIRLANGKTVYAYQDDGCPELDSAAERLAALRSY